MTTDLVALLAEARTFSKKWKSASNVELIWAGGLVTRLTEALEREQAQMAGCATCGVTTHE